MAGWTDGQTGGRTGGRMAGEGWMDDGVVR